MTTATTLQEKADSKKWIDALGDDIEVVQDGIFIISLLLAQVRSWNEIHLETANIFGEIIEGFNRTIVFGKDEDGGQNIETAMSDDSPTQTPPAPAEGAE